jgi:polar amino acid transport system permease protein
VLALIATQARNRWLRIGIAIYVDFFRAFPPLVLLILIYFGSPFLGLEIPKLMAVAIGFMLNNSSYFSEVFRAGIEAVPKGQMEAARSTGLSKLQALTFVIVPQATRNVLPDLVGNCIEVVKLTTIASVVALPELLRAARDAQSLVYNPSPIVLAAALYLVLLWPAVRLLSRLEHRGRAVR